MCFLFLLIIINGSLVKQSEEQSSDFTITSDLYGWTREMKRLDITTPERDLIFEITIKNDDNNNPLSFENLIISITITKEGETNPEFSKEYNQFLYIPAKESRVLLFPVDLGYNQYNPEANIGKYSVDLKYKYEYNDYIIEPYPYEFKIVGKDQFKKEIDEARVAFIIIDIQNLTLPAIGGTSIAGVIAYIILEVRKKRKEETP